MQKRLIPTIIFILYIALLIKVMVFKSLPMVRVGHLMLNFGGTETVGQPNFIPFKTIGPYLLGYKGWIIAGINLIGNIILLVPIGFLIPFMFKNLSWKNALVIGIISGLTIEILQTILHVGIFDIDDVILNALGVMIGYWIFKLLARWVHAKNYVALVIAALIVIAATVAGAHAVSLSGQQAMDFRNGAEGPVPQGGNLCGDTNGTGAVVSVGSTSFVMQRNDNKNQTINVSEHATIKDSTGPITLSDLKAGERVTLVGGPNPDGSFATDVVLVCGTATK